MKTLESPALKPQAESTLDPTPEPALLSSPKSNDATPASPRKKKKKSALAKLNAAVMMWVRRIHLFTGLFMLPWVLLYGFTAMLFNHSTWFSDSRIESVALDQDSLAALPSSQDIAKQVIDQLRSEGQEIELAELPDAYFTRSGFVSYEMEDTNETLVVDLNTGKGYRRIRPKSDDEGKEKEKATLATGLPVAIDVGDSLDVSDIVAKENGTPSVEKKKIKLQSIPTLEFNALVDGELKRLRFSSRSSRRRGRSTNAENNEGKSDPSRVNGSVAAVGENPRSMSWRSYLLRLHMAHGYPNTTNARYWWAYAVDAMFLTMVFWGISGVFMWWQIKRTRTIGIILLVASGLVATYLAFAMHWQLVNG